MRNLGRIWIVNLLMLAVFAVIDVESGGMTIFVSCKDADQLSLDLSSDATVGDVFTAAAPFGVQSGILRFRDIEYQDPIVSLADIGVRSGTTVEVYPIPIRWTLETLDSRKPIFRAEIKRSGRAESIPVYLQWLPYRSLHRPPRGKMEICSFMLVMAPQSNPSTFTPYRYQRLDTQQQRAEFPHYARLQDIFDEQRIRNDSSQTLPRVFVNIGDSPLNYDNSNVFSFDRVFPLHCGQATYFDDVFRVVVKGVVSHDGELMRTRPITTQKAYLSSIILILLIWFIVSDVNAAIGFAHVPQ